MVIDSEGQLPLPWLAAPLRQVLGHSRGHALLVHGAPGVGALEFALVLAQSWLCEQRGGDTARACGRCESCRLVRQFPHPDLMVQVPEQLALDLGWPVDVPSERKPSRQLRVGQVRDAIAWAGTTSGRGRGKVLILHPAETLNEVAASAFLKTLEEPGAGLRIVLTAAEPDRLLPTVRSRCQWLRLPRPERDIALDWLQQRGVDGAEVLLAAAGGRPLDALQMHQSGITAAVWRQLGPALAAGDTRAFAGWRAPQLVQTLLKLCHDGQRLAWGAEPLFFPAGALTKPANPAALAGWQRELMRVARHAEHPWHEGLLLDAMVGQGRAAWLAPSRARSTGAAANAGAAVALPFDTLPL